MMSGEILYASLLNNTTKANFLRDVFDRFLKNEQARRLEAYHAYSIRQILLINACDSFFFSFFPARFVARGTST